MLSYKSTLDVVLEPVNNSLYQSTEYLMAESISCRYHSSLPLTATVCLPLELTQTNTVTSPTHFFIRNPLAGHSVYRNLHSYRTMPLWNLPLYRPVSLLEPPLLQNSVFMGPSPPTEQCI